MHAGAHREAFCKRVSIKQRPGPRHLQAVQHPELHPVRLCQSCMPTSLLTPGPSDLASGLQSGPVDVSCRPASAPGHRAAMDLLAWQLYKHGEAACRLHPRPIPPCVSMVAPTLQFLLDLTGATDPGRSDIDQKKRSSCRCPAIHVLHAPMSRCVDRLTCMPNCCYTPQTELPRSSSWT